MTDPIVERQTKTLLNVLKLEAKYGFNNSSVLGGGLDVMWPNLDRIGGQIRSLPPMNGRRYSSMTQREREVWSDAAIRRLGGGGVEQRPAPVDRRRQAPARPAKKAVENGRPRPIVRRELDLGSPVASLSFLHPATKKAFEALGLRTLRDVLWHFPLRLIDYTQRSNIVDLKSGEEATVEGDVVSSEVSRFAGRGGLARVRIRDGTGFLTVTWFNMPYMATRWQAGDRIVVSGKVGDYRGRPTMENPEYDDVTRGGKNNQRGFHSCRRAGAGVSAERGSQSADGSERGYAVSGQWVAFR